jgi:selenium metabolism protein YedF
MCAGINSKQVKKRSEIMKKNVFLVVSSDAMGKEEKIGKIVIKNFFETIKATKEIPHTIFFLNAGVKLTTVNKKMVSILKEIESMGAEIYSCGTCLEYYNLESKLMVGHRGASTQVVEAFNEFKKVIWI